MITVATIVRNERRRFLPSALECWSEFADRIVAVDDGSKDGTHKLLEEHGCEVYRETFDLWGNETAARKFLWEKAVKGSDWVVHIDADMVPSGDFRRSLKGSLAGFCVFDMWDLQERPLVDGPPTPALDRGEREQAPGREMEVGRRRDSFRASSSERPGTARADVPDRPRVRDAALCVFAA